MSTCEHCGVTNIRTFDRPRSQWAFRDYTTAQAWAEKCRALGLTAVVDDPGWGTNEWIVSVRLNPVLARLLGIPVEDT